MGKNAFKELKEQYAGKSTEVDIDKYTDIFLEMYENTYNKIYKKLSDYYTEIDYPTYVKQEALLKQIGKILDDFSIGFGDKFKQAIEQASKFATLSAIKGMSYYKDATKSLDWHYDFAKKYAETTFNDNYQHIAAQTNNIKETIKKNLQSTATKTFQRASVEGLSRKEAYKLIKEEMLAKHPKFEFVDKAGRKWDTKKYFEMLTRTVIMNSLRESYVNTLTNEGQDLVKVSINGAKDACRNWEGKILSLTGATKGYPTLSDAIASGEIFHPRCRHRLVAYHPDIEDAFDMSEEEARETYSKEKEEKKRIIEANKSAFDVNEIDLENTELWERVGGQLGSNIGGIYKDKITGDKYYVKLPKTPTHAFNEYFANQLYKKAGVNVPELNVKKLKGGKYGVFSKWEEGLETLGDTDKILKNKQLKRELYNQFAIDAWLANWDVAGLTYDNIAIKNGKIFKIDAGGSLLFRAQGTPKGDLFGGTVNELATFRDKGINPQSARLFQDITDKEIKAGINKLKKISDKQIKELILGSDLYSLDYQSAIKIYRTLIERKKYLLNYFGKKANTTLKTGKSHGIYDVTEFEPDELEEFKRRWEYQNTSVFQRLRYYDKNYSALKSKFQQFAEPYLNEINATDEDRKFVRTAQIWTTNFFSNVSSWKYDYPKYEWKGLDDDALITKAVNNGLKILAKSSDFDAHKLLAKKYGNIYKNDKYLRTYRGSNGAHDIIPLLKDIKNKNGVFIPHSLMSTSPSAPYEHKAVLIEFRLKKEAGKYAYVRKISEYEGEDEILLQSGLKYRVVEIKEIDKTNPVVLHYGREFIAHKYGWEWKVVLEEI